LPGTEPYNPLDKPHLAESVGGALLSQPVHPLAPGRFEGAGLYAIYYTGPFPAYSRVSTANANGQYAWPIYVGRALPEGTRTANADGTHTYKLSGRLKQHQRSVEAVDNLDAADFTCRYLVVDPLWIPLGESLLLGRFRPVWNVRVDGFGIHAPGGGRGQQRRSSWDTLHPGRAYAASLPPNDRTQDEIIRSVTEFLAAVDVQPEVCIPVDEDDPPATLSHPSPEV
jgi:hypothetical protein